MIALRPLKGKIGKTTWSVREGKTIPERIIKTLDVDALKKSKCIAESPKRKNEESTKVDD